MQAFSYKIFISHQIHIPILSSVSGLQLLHIWLFYLFLLCGSALQIPLSYYISTYRQLIVENYIIIFEVFENEKVVAVVTVKYGKSEF